MTLVWVFKDWPASKSTVNISQDDATFFFDEHPSFQILTSFLLFGQHWNDSGLGFMGLARLRSTSENFQSGYFFSQSFLLKSISFLVSDGLGGLWGGFPRTGALWSESSVGLDVTHSPFPRSSRIESLERFVCDAGELVFFCLL